jgi:IMP dehydrogenase
MHTLGALNIVPVWLEPDHLVWTARLLLEGHRVPAIGVVDSNHKLIGWVTPHLLQQADPNHKLREYMSAAPVGIDMNLAPREAASLFIDREADYLPVNHQNQFVGVATARSLLGKLRESWDPMTSLPWSDVLREWGIKQLQDGVEIAILFVDLNQFGKFNKHYGHVIGDRVLQRVARHLQEHCDPKTDVVVRYGGDEFAIGTIRDREHAVLLAEALRGDGKGLTIPDIEVPIEFSIGIYGGRRIKVRENIHEPANVDNLVNLASQDCLANKHIAVPSYLHQSDDEEQTASGRQPVAEAINLPVDGSPVIETIQVDDDPQSLSYVVLRTNTGLHVGVAEKTGRSQGESVALATAKALERAYSGCRVEVKDLKSTVAGSTELITLEVTVQRDGFEREITAEVEANGDLPHSVASAVVSAFFAE